MNKNKQKFYILLILIITLAFTTKALASLTFTTNAITGTTDSTIDLGSGHNLILQTSGGNVGIGDAPNGYERLYVLGDGSTPDAAAFVQKTNLSGSNASGWVGADSELALGGIANYTNSFPSSANYNYSENTSSGIVTALAGNVIDTIVNSGGGSITNAYGLWIADQTAGTNNWAIKTGLGEVEFGDKLVVTSHGDDSAIQGIANANANGQYPTGFDGEADAGTYTTPYAAAIYAGSVTGSAITDVYGIEVANQTVGTNNWAIKTGLGKVEFGDIIQSDVAAFASLPACAGGTEGSMRAVNNSSSNTWGATITGGGANHVMAYCDGTNWTVMGK